MYPDNKRIITLHYSRSNILSAIETICRQKSEYELLEEVSLHGLQIFVKHFSRVLQKETGYYLKVSLKEVVNDGVQLTAETSTGLSPLSTSSYFDSSNVIKEFIFILRHYLEIAGGAEK